MPENITQKDIKPYITWGLLLLCCVLLIATLLNLYKNNQIGRYAFFKDEDFSFYVLDTKTGQVWYRIVFVKDTSVVLVDYGTPANPVYDVIGTQTLKRPNVIDFIPDTNASVDTHGVISGILYDEESPTAIIDGKVVGEGQAINGVKIIKIHPDYVEFEKAGSRWSQKVNEQPSSFWP